MRGFYYVDDQFSRNNSKNNNIPLPHRGTSQAAGYDFYSPLDVLVAPNETVLIWTDVKVALGANECLKIYPRSSTAVKKNLVLKNSVGIIDADYFENSDNNGNIGIPLLNTGKKVELVRKGEKIAQGIFETFLTTLNDSQTNIRTGGFGSTGV